MKNIFGQKLDSNGYAPSIAVNQDKCFLCGRRDRALHRHEVYHGNNRTKSKNLGCWVNVCDLCHDRIHRGGDGLDFRLKQEIQAVAMEHYGWSVDDFRAEFGKNYL